ncbi:hypothetical protein CANCADRAFT_139796 [Tortispora caseinolytica NRRL Y-17796]|uniref:Protein-S-isoprenylcysteine O-methyltransferase n=1 Tax=Tortispora caseinolytica NRRL Y-17796 TaxID=767744 RepID=A0A1E4TCG6_9ASCO|nr:hypothetical protein CANCADRAFT_139796 [Tortispora caseinolytica NRRL Y-17796]
MAERLKEFQLSETAEQQPLSVTQIWVASVLGGGVFAGAILFFDRLEPLFLYMSFLCFFHDSEYFVTAIFNPTRLEMSSFLLNNGFQYWIAHLSGLVECYFHRTHPFFVDKTVLYAYQFVGLAAVVIGQYVRTKAMAYAASSFSHKIADKKAEDHVLVTDGVYAYVRHPSYAAFFVWAVGTQIWLGNVITPIAFCIVLQRFFTARIRHEESLLIKFFGADYTTYKSKVPSGILFLP